MKEVVFGYLAFLGIVIGAIMLLIIFSYCFCEATMDFFNIEKKDRTRYWKSIWTANFNEEESLCDTQSKKKNM